VNRQQKTEAIQQLNETFTVNPHVILTTFSGLSVNQATELRGKIRGAGGSFKVIKNRLAKRAAVGTPVEQLSDRLTGPCAIATHADDPVVLAKTLAEFSKDNPQLEMLAGMIDAKSVIDVDGVKQLAKMPGLPELRAQLMSVIQTPASQLVRLLGTPGSQLARVVDARREQQEGSA
jgi:large subunit ribosomal protein L10